MYSLMAVNRLSAGGSVNVEVTDRLTSAHLGSVARSITFFWANAEELEELHHALDEACTLLVRAIAVS